MRKLGTIRKVDEIRPIEGADAIELAVFGGWQVVVK
ncbi:MAG: RNA ligase (ATP), partial [Deltaproteobacteria bacterium]